MVTTTPRPIALLKRLLADPRTVQTGGKTKDNLSLRDMDITIYYRAEAERVAELGAKYAGQSERTDEGFFLPAYNLVLRMARNTASLSATASFFHCTTARLCSSETTAFATPDRSRPVPLRSGG